MPDKKKIFALIPLVLLFILTLFTFDDGCSKKQADIYAMPFAVKSAERSFIAVQTYDLTRKEDRFTIFSSKNISLGNWTKPKSYQGNIKAALPGKDDSFTAVFESGSVVDFKYENGKYSSSSREFKPLSVIDAAGTSDSVFALTFQDGNFLHVYEYAEKSWKKITGKLKPLSAITNPKITVLDRTIYLIWQQKNPSGNTGNLRWAKYESGDWKILPVPQVSLKGNISKFKAVGNNIFLLTQKSISGSFFKESGISVYRYNSSNKKWTELPAINTPEKFNEGFTSLADITEGDEDNAIVILSAGNSLSMAKGDIHTLKLGKFEAITETETVNPTTELVVMLSIFLIFIGLGIFQIIIKKRQIRQHALGDKKENLAQSIIEEPLLLERNSLLAIGGIASPLERGIALAIDIFITLPLLVAFIAAQGLSFQNLADANELVDKVIPAALFYNFSFMVYTTITELLWNQTVGKKALGLYVRNITGGKASRMRIVIRNILRSIDTMTLPIPGLEIPFLPAIISMIFSKTNQRIGDRFANTIVVRRVPVETRKIILASTSPRREELLKSMGLAFESIAPEIEERIFPALSPHENAVRLAQEKADFVGNRLSGNEIIIAADTIISFNGQIIGKPEDREDAKNILKKLSAGHHQVITGLAIWDKAVDRKIAAFDITDIQMNPLTDRQIEEYVESGEADGKAGAYAIQENGRKFVRYINGSYSNVVGLPLEVLRAILDEFEI